MSFGRKRSSASFRGTAVAAKRTAMVASTRLKDPAPKDVPSVELKHWDVFKVKSKDPVMNDTVKKFILEMVIDGMVEKFPVTGANEDSVLALFTAALCAQMPRISGFNLYDEQGKMVASVPAMMFLAKLAESKDVDAGKIEQLKKLLSDPKTPKADEFAKVFSAPAGGDVK